MEPVTGRWARIGPEDRKWLVHVPAGGLCLSAFVLVRNRKGDVLFGRPRPHRNWPEKGGVGVWRIRDVARLGSWTLPATHLLMREHPEHAARRIARTWAGLTKPRPRLVGIDSSHFPVLHQTRPGGRIRRAHHWALGFVYEVRTSRTPRVNRAWSELRFVPVSKLRSLRIGREHRGFLKYLSPGG